MIVKMNCNNVNPLSNFEMLNMKRKIFKMPPIPLLDDF